MKALRQATKLWQEELDPEFGRSSKNIGAWLQKPSRPDNASRGPSPFMKLGRIYPQGGRCWEALREVEGSGAASSGRRSRGQDASRPARSAELTEADAPNLYSSGTSVSPLTQKEGRPMPSLVLARIATTGIYLLHDVPRDLQRAARACAGREGITVRWVLRQALREYAGEPGHHSQMRNRARRL